MDTMLSESTTRNLSGKFRFTRIRIDLTNKRFGKLIVVSKGEHFVQKCGRKVSTWRCKCDCGIFKDVPTSSLTSNRVISCGCMHGHKLKLRRSGYLEISGTYWSNIKGTAYAREILWDITVEQAYNLFLLQNRKCAISGIEITMGTHGGKGNRRLVGQSASLDRIDSSQGYIIANVQWVHKIVNMMKNTLSQYEFINWCKLVAKTHE